MLDLMFYLGYAVVMFVGVYTGTMFFYYTYYLPYSEKLKTEQMKRAMAFYDCVDLFFVADYNGTYTEIYGNVLKEMGIRSGELIGKSIYDNHFRVKYESETDEKKIQEAHRKVLDTGKPVRVEFYTIFGRVRILNVASIVLEPEHSKIIGIIITSYKDNLKND